MFVFSLAAEVGGYWYCYLNRGKAFLSLDRKGGGGGRRKEESGGGGEGDLAVTFWHCDSGTCGHESHTFLQLMLTLYSCHLVLRVCVCALIPCPVGAVGGNPPTHARTNTHTFTFQSVEHPPSYPSSVSSTGTHVPTPVQQNWTSSSQNKHKTDHQSHWTFMARK